MRARGWIRIALVATALGVAGCGDGGDGDADDAAGAPDAADDDETGTGIDASVPDSDASSAVDATPDDATGMQDAGLADAAVPDAAALDAAAPDAAALDAGLPDAAAPDAAVPDAAIPDASPPDATPAFTLTVTASPGGTVTSSPGAIDCTSAGGTCSDAFAQDTTVTLTAAPAVDYAFSGWTGDCVGTETAVELAITADATCHASFLGTGGDITLIPPPTSVVPNVTEHDTDIMIFIEQLDLALTDALPIDIHVPATYTSRAPAAKLPAGLRVNVYFVHYDPVGTPSTPINTLASLTFPEPIVGLITDLPTLRTTDTLVGTSGVAYPDPSSHPDRELELDSNDRIALSADRLTLDLDLLTTTSSDQLRVVTLVPGQELPEIVSDNLIIDAPPSSVVAGATESGSLLSCVERAGHTLAADLDVDTATPGLYDANADLVPGTVSAGTVVRSQLIHFDPIGATTTVRTASVTFDRDILGIIVRAASLDATDGVLGSATTTYPSPGSEPTREVELASDETVYFSADGRSLLLTLRAASGVDQLRVLLAD